MEDITIHTPFIKLGQLLKLAGLIDQGSDVKIFLSEDMVLVNGSPVSQRGKKVMPGDIVELRGRGSIRVVSGE